MGQKPTTSKYIEVRESEIHGTGVFARIQVPKGKKVIEYIGEKITKKESERRSITLIEKNQGSETDGAVYIFEVNKRHDIDGNIPENTARFINHSCDPNCEPDVIRNRVWLISTRKIKKGEELSYNYGFDLEDYEEHKCKCGAEKCVGYITDEDNWPKLKKLITKKRKKAKKAKKKSAKKTAKAKKKSKKKARK
jgi:SET domain-containing protein